MHVILSSPLDHRRDPHVVRTWYRPQNWAERPLVQALRNRRGPASLPRADDGIRTRDPNLGKVVLYQLSHVRVGHHFSYLRNFEKRRSARGLPPVWHVGQYWSDLPEKATCRTRSPHTGHGCPVRPCTRRPSFFSFLSPA